MREGAEGVEPLGGTFPIRILEVHNPDHTPDIDTNLSWEPPQREGGDVAQELMPTGQGGGFHFWAPSQHSCPNSQPRPHPSHSPCATHRQPIMISHYPAIGNF